MSNKPDEIRFEKFCLSFSHRCLFRGDEVISLTGKEYEILAALLEAEGKVVRKETMGERLWPNKEVEPSNLFHHVKSLRAKLGLRQDGQSFIDTIPGRGYRLRLSFKPEDSSLSANPPDESSSSVGPSEEAPPPSTETRLSANPILRGKYWKWLTASLLVAAIIAGTRLYSSWKSLHADSPPAIALLTSPDKGAGPTLLKLIQLGSDAGSALLITGRGELYVSELAKTVSIIDIGREEVVNRIAVESVPGTLAASADGKRIFVAQQGGVGVIDVAAHSYRRASTFRGPVYDLVMTRDGKSAYLAAGFAGLVKLDLATEKTTVISKIVFARALTLTPDGHRLYVSYQAKGPGGTFGHDAIGYFDTATDQFAGAISGFANVGECLTASPDSTQIWENGEDACDSPQYDHVGCPFVPGGLLNILNTSRNKLVKAVGVRGARLQCVTFSPDGKIALVGTTDHLMFLRAADLAMTASLPIGSTGRIAFSDDGLKAYAPVNAKPQLAVIRLGVQVQPLRLTNRENEDKTLQVAIPSKSDFDAKSIDPASLELAGVPAEKGRDGSIAASIETVSGFEGHCLVVKFKLVDANIPAKLPLAGRTYSGMRIRGMLDYF